MKMTAAMKSTKAKIELASKSVVRYTLALHAIESDLSKNFGQIWDAQDRLRAAQERYDSLIERLRDLPHPGAR